MDRLARALNQEGVVAASLFGSRAGGRAVRSPMSTWPCGPNPDLPAPALSRLPLDLALKRQPRHWGPARSTSYCSTRRLTDYAGVFAALGAAGSIDPALTERLGKAPRQRNFLVRAYLDVDDRLVLAALDRLDDLRDFAAAVQRAADEG